MSKKQFTLDSWLKDKSQKVVTRCGFPVRIVCTDVKRKDYPILALVERDDQEEYQSFTKDGRFSLYNPLHDNFDLFIETADEVSEDEKMRKEIINYFRCQSEEEPTRKEIHNKWIAWLENIPVTIDHEKRDGFHLGYRSCLEKQDEQIDIANKEYWRGYREGKKLILDKYAEIEKQGEQKFEMKTAEESLGMDSDTYNKIVDECIFGKQKPEENNGNIGGISANSEWSEEDDWMKKKIILVLLGSETFLTPEETNELVYWLKSLKDKVQPQPKQEWSEEDEQHIDSLLKRLDALCRNKFERTRFAISEDRDWLKSLRPQNRWKPSDNELEVLRLVAEKDGTCLMGLYEQLKKLKEGKV